MMYQSKMVCCLKANGKVLRENKDTVFLPFGSEYSIFLKNLNSVRAQVRVSVDGTDVTEGTSLVINPNSELDLKRFIKNGNLETGNSFKFIERTAGIENHRGVKAEDGLIRVEFQFEKIYPVWNGLYYTDYYGSPTLGGGVLRGVATNSTITYSSNSMSVASAAPSLQTSGEVHTYTAQAENDVGITVPGSKVDQKFTTVNSFPLETEKHVIILHLLGETESGKQVVQPVTVKAKPKCSSCGRVNKANAKFCTECGTALELF
jgi:hypothetical protein